MEKKRFFYNHSFVYGWCVYDREYGSPAYEACAKLLSPVKEDIDGAIMESPTMLENEYKAMRLCARLNVAYKRVMKSGC